MEWYEFAHVVLINTIGKNQHVCNFGECVMEVTHFVFKTKIKYVGKYPGKSSDPEPPEHTPKEFKYSYFCVHLTASLN